MPREYPSERWKLVEPAASASKSIEPVAAALFCGVSDPARAVAFGLFVTATLVSCAPQTPTFAARENFAPCSCSTWWQPSSLPVLAAPETQFAKAHSPPPPGPTISANTITQAVAAKP